MRTTYAVLSALGIGLLAFAAGRWSVHRPWAATPATSTMSKSPSPRPIRPATDDLDACQDRLDAAIALLEAQELEKNGVPVGFPPDLPSQYRPDGFAPAVREALAGCPEAPLELARVDCSEYPCMAFFSQPTGTLNHGVDDLAACPAWGARFAPGGQANDSFMSDAGSLEYGMLAPRPTPQAMLDENEGKRFRARLDETRAALMDEWGGREPTPLEQVDASIAFWREHGEGEFAQTVLTQMEAQRTALQAAP